MKIVKMMKKEITQIQINMIVGLYVPYLHEQHFLLVENENCCLQILITIQTLDDEKIMARNIIEFHAYDLVVHLHRRILFHRNNLILATTIIICNNYKQIYSNNRCHNKLKLLTKCTSVSAAGN